MLINDAMIKTGTSATNIYKYIRLGLVNPKQNMPGAPYDFSEEDVELINFIKNINKLQLFKILKVCLGKDFKVSKLLIILLKD